MFCLSTRKPVSAATNSNNTRNTQRPNRTSHSPHTTPCTNSSHKCHKTNQARSQGKHHRPRSIEMYYRHGRAAILAPHVCVHPCEPNTTHHTTQHTPHTTHHTTHNTYTTDQRRCPSHTRWETSRPTQRTIPNQYDNAHPARIKTGKLPRRIRAAANLRARTNITAQRGPFPHNTGMGARKQDLNQGTLPHNIDNHNTRNDAPQTKGTIPHNSTTLHRRQRGQSPPHITQNATTGETAPQPTNTPRQTGDIPPQNMTIAPHHDKHSLVTVVVSLSD